MQKSCLAHTLVAALLATAVFTGCSGDSGTGRAPSSAPQAKPSSARSSKTNEAPSKSPPPIGERLAVLQPIFRREGDVTVVDRLSAAHSFGGWRTNSDIVVYCAGDLPLTDSARCHDADLRTAWLTDGKRAAMMLLPPEVRGQKLTLSLQGHAALFIDGKEVSQIDANEWSLTSIDVPEGDGFVRLGLRAQRRSKVRLGKSKQQRTGAAVRWLAYGPETASEEIGAHLANHYASPTRAIAYPIHLTDEQAPGQIQLYGVMNDLELTWVGSDGKRTRLEESSRYDATSPSQKPPGHIYAIYNLDDKMRDGLLEVRSKDKESSALDLTLHQSPNAKSGQRPVEEEKIAPAKNVIVFLVDTLRADKLRIYEKSSRVQTPALDKWAEGATRFTAAHTQENWTKPSVATLLSSTMPWQHNATTGDAVLPRRIATMSELLQKEGFYTGFFSANGYVSDKFGFGRGWHTYRNYIREGRKNPAQYVARDVMEWLDKRPKDKRFFLYVHTIDPHVPYRPPSEFSEMYDPEPYSGVVNFRKDATLLENIKIGRIKLRERDKTQLVALYDGEITYHDVWFGKILEGLAERGLDQNTAMVFTSDHGEEFWDHGSVGHGHNVYEELLHIPMVMRIPGIKKHRDSIDAPMGLVDVAPTMFEALGLEKPPSFEGQSQLDKITGSAPIEQTATVSGFMDNWRTIVLGDWKLIMKGNLNPRLYHLPSDPTEQTNVIDKHPMVAWSLMQRLGQELGRTAPKASQGGAKPKVEKTTIDPTTREQLRALGYIE